MEDFGIAVFIVFMVIGLFFACFVVGVKGYKQGQLDFQRGQVEWLLVGPDEVHHIQKGK